MKTIYRMAATALLVPCSADAVDGRIFDRIASSTSLVTAVSYEAWSGTRTLDRDEGLAYPRVALEAKSHLGDSLSAVFDSVLVGTDEALGRNGALVALREAYLAFRSDRLRIKGGSQIISWGRTDLISPTDNLSAQKYTWLTASDSDQKAGPVSISAEWLGDEGTVQFVWQPLFRPDDVPLPPIANYRYVKHRPEGLAETSAVRYNAYGPLLSWSVSYLQGPSKRPNLAAQLGNVQQGRLDLDYPFTRIVGADLELLHGHWVVRGDAAYNWVDGSGTSALASRESFFLGVVQLERDLGDVSAFLQTIHRRTSDYVDPDQAPVELQELARAAAALNDERYRALTGIGGGVNYSTPDLGMRASVDVAYFADLDDWSVRPRMRYRMTDTALIDLGADYFSGETYGPLGRLRDNRVAFIRLQYTFSLD